MKLTFLRHQRLNVWHHHLHQVNIQLISFSRPQCINEIIGSRSPQRYLRPRDRVLRSYDQTELGDQYQHAQGLLSDFEDILLQVNGDFLSKEEAFRSEIPIGVHLEELPIEFNYVKIFIYEISEREFKFLIFL